MKSRIVSAVLVCALLAACQGTPRPEARPDVAPDTAPAPAAESWVKTELYFAIAPAEAEGLGLSAAEGVWRSFLDEEVTPRFPDGLTVLDAHGQWREEGRSEPGRERSRVLVIVHPATPAKRAGIEAIREAYKARTGEQSVLAVETPIAPPRF
jgi:Protein of unknown function (DUF3574).